MSDNFSWDNKDLKRGRISCHCGFSSIRFEIRRFQHDNIVYAICCYCGEEIKLSDIIKDASNAKS